MRRIIERVVTVVTTTTWKISWEPDLSPGQPMPNPVVHELPSLETLPESMPSGSTVIETKEVYPHETEEIPKPPAEILPGVPKSIRSKKGRKKL